MFNASSPSSQETCIDSVVNKFDPTRSSNVKASTRSIQLVFFFEEEPDADMRFREVVGGTMRFAHQTRPDNTSTNAKSAVERYTHAP